MKVVGEPPAPRLRCVRWIALLAAIAACGACGPAETDPRNLLIFVIDTLRADRLGIYGNPRPTTPNIDAFARQGIVFDNAFAPTPHTAPSHASLFTSTYPSTHGIWNDLESQSGKTYHPRLSPNCETLAEVLQRRGYQTAAIADGGWVSGARALDQGFDLFDSRRRGVRNRIDAAIQWLSGRDATRPFFLFLHTYQVHAPYLPPEGYEDRFMPDYRGPVREALQSARDWVRDQEIGEPPPDIDRKFFQPLHDALTEADREFMLALYDAELAFVDEVFAQLRDYLERTRLLEDTLVILTADHGEEFGEHGRYRHYQVYTEGVRIPLIVRFPNGPRGLRRTELIDLVDVMPSVLFVLGVDAPEATEGRTLALGAPDPELREERMLVGEVNHLGDDRQLSVRSRRFSALFQDRSLRNAEVFARDADPGEQHDVADTPAGRRFLETARVTAREYWDRSARHREAHRLDPVFIERQYLSKQNLEELRALGYLRD